VISLARRDIEDRLFADFEPLVRDGGVELLDVEMLSENRNTVLRATIYKPEGITLDDCVRAQHILSDRLDETDPIQGSYSLEVSSPGIERVLRRPKEFAIFKGKPCQVSLFSPQNGKRVFEGRLVELETRPDGSEAVVIEVDDEASRSGKATGRKQAGGKSAAAKPAGEEPEVPRGKRLVSFDRKNVSKVKLLYREEDYRKGLN